MHVFLFGEETPQRSTLNPETVDVGASDTALDASVVYGDYPVELPKCSVVLEGSSDAGVNWTTLATLTSASPDASAVDVSSYQSGLLRIRPVSVDAPVKRAIAVGIALS